PIFPRPGNPPRHVDLADSDRARPAPLEPAVEDPGRSARQADGSLFIERRAHDLRPDTFRPPIPGIRTEPAAGDSARGGRPGRPEPLVAADRAGPGVCPL